ncbi:MAG: hypothetical protein B2I17_03705 [Thermoplasmatales archaeon B_DKE]|nr:MAG: hypothetical protein B2I17_03705 [Thermoplasmatales archaeon B_DKE]
MNAFLILLITVAVLSAIHMMAPDHWLPVVLISRRENYTRRRRLNLSLMLSSVHAVTSTVLAVGIVFLSLLFLHQFSTYLKDAGIVLMFAVGVYFFFNGVTEKSDEASFVKYSFILGVSASPDLSLLPLLIEAQIYPSSYSELMILVFAFVSIVSLMIVVTVADFGIGKSLQKLEPRYMDYVMGAILIGIGIFLFFS